jgi:hypothetical protein
MLPVIRQNDLPQPSAAFQADRIGKDDRGFPCLKAGRGLTEHERAALIEARALIDAWLAPALAGQVAMFVSTLRLDRKERDQGEAIDDARASLYLEVLGDLPGAALTATLRGIIRDEFPELSPTFMPTATELRRVVMRVAEKARAEHRWIDHVLALPEGPRETSPEEHAALAEKFDAAAKQLAAESAEKHLGEIALAAMRDANAAAAISARHRRVAADLANRNFPPAPSELQAPLEAEAGKGVA